MLFNMSLLKIITITIFKHKINLNSPYIHHSLNFPSRALLKKKKEKKRKKRTTCFYDDPILLHAFPNKQK